MKFNDAKQLLGILQAPYPIEPVARPDLEDLQAYFLSHPTDATVQVAKASMAAAIVEWDDEQIRAFLTFLIEAPASELLVHKSPQILREFLSDLYRVFFEGVTFPTHYWD